MFKLYLGLMKELFSRIFNGSTQSATLKDYVMVLFYSFSIILSFAFIAIVLYITIKLPRKIYDRFISRYKDEYNQLLVASYSDQTLKNKVDYARCKISKMKTAFCWFILCVYVPIVLPLVLILLDFLVNTIW